MIKPILRIALLVMFATVAITVPALNKYHHKLAATDIPLAESVGLSFHIAGQDPVDEEEAAGIVLEAQDLCQVGELVRFDATASNVDGLTWQILPNTPDFEVIENGRRAFFSAREPGKFLVIIAGAKGGTPYLQHHTIVVEGEAGPGPKTTTLTSKVADWVKKVEAYEGKAAKAKALAEVFRNLATKEDLEADDVLEATAVANSAVLGEDLDKWVPFLDALGQELDLYVENEDLSTREDYREVWLLIAAGIERSIPVELVQNEEKAN